MRLAVALLVALAGCSRQSSVTSDPDTAQATATKPGAGTPVVDDATAGSCTVTYSCGLSHPGLGSSSRTTSVDFATCERTAATESGPFQSNVPTAFGDGATRLSTNSTTHLSSADCARVRAAAVALTQEDARAAQESAHIDTEACGLTLACKGEPAPRLSVQRQTTTGPSRVEKLIRAVLGQSP